MKSCRAGDNRNSPGGAGALASDGSGNSETTRIKMPPESGVSDGVLVSRALDSGGQAIKGAWGMSRRQEALKGAEDCDKPGVTVKQVMIPGFPN